MRIKATFMIFIIVCSIFYISLLAPPTEATYTGYCCAKNTQGEFCKQAQSLDECDSSFTSAYGVACAYVEFCAVGCCVSDDGSCFKNTNKISCQNSGGTWHDDNSCNSLNSCQKGCCVLGNDYEYSTERECENKYSIFPNLAIDFRDITENECTQLNLLKQQGCCVDSCSYGTKEECNSISQDSLAFKPNIYCSDVVQCEGQCEKQDHIKCVDEDAYWFDSCGNQEDIALDCDREQGTVCGENDDDSISCRSMDCNDPVYGERKHTESWCDYDNKNMIDSVGSRHYLRTCIDGKIVYSECRDYREEICIETINEKGLMEASCIENDGSFISLGSRFWSGGDCTDFGNYGAKSAELDDDNALIQFWVNKQSVNCSQIGDCGNDYNYLGVLSKGGLGSSCGEPTEYPSAGSNALQMGQVLAGSIGGISSSLAYLGVAAGTLGPLGAALMATALVMTIFYFAGIFGSDKVVCIVTCNDWIPPAGGADCSKCTDDPTKPCTEYKCKSLGETCEFINKGTEYEACTSVEKLDPLSPVIEPWNEVLTEGFTLETTSNGYKIKEDVPADQEIVFGVKTNEYARCKYSITPNKAYEEMAFYFGQGLLLEEHKNNIVIPSYFSDPQFYSITNGVYKIYLRCQDANGNANKNDYVITSTSTESEDKNAPAIIDALTSEGIRTNSKLSYQINKTDLSLYLNEPAECNYAKDSDMDYEQMSFSFSCAISYSEIDVETGYYKCTTHLENLRHDVDNNLYIRCRDRPNKPLEQRKTNEESFIFTLEKTLPLEIKSTYPTDEVFTTTTELKITTEKGADANGNAICGFTDNTARGYTPFLQTGGSIHTQPLGSQENPLEKGKYDYSIQCIDNAGTIVTDKIEFSIAVDKYPPEIFTIFQQGNNIVVTLNDNSLCEYSDTNFGFGSGTSTGGVATKIHTFPFVESIFIQCKDDHNNIVSFSVYT